MSPSEQTLMTLAEDIGPIDALICSAGINLRPDDNRPEQLTLDAWTRTLAVNLTGTMLTVRAFRPTIRADGPPSSLSAASRPCAPCRSPTLTPRPRAPSRR